MDESGIIRESDLIKLDGTIDRLITQLEELNASYSSVVGLVKSGAAGIAKSLKSASGATREGRKAIDESAAAAGRLERAEKELAFAMSETGKQVAILKAQTSDTNRATVAQQRALEAAVSSYDKIKAEVKELTALYKSLSEAERQDANFGGELVKQIQEQNRQLVALDNAIKPHIQQLSALQKAKQQLAYYESEEGKELLKVRAKIRELTSARKEAGAAASSEKAVKAELAAIIRGERNELIQLNAEKAKATQNAKLAAKEAIAEKGSYDQISATYARAKKELQSMNITLPENAERVELLTKELNEAYAQMKLFQESVGVHSLNVGNYASSFGRLGFSVQQVVRELPSLAVSANTFFLAISNNIPMLVDEVQKSKVAFEAQKKAVIDAGLSAEETAKRLATLEKPITTVIKSLFSWQTALVLVLTILPKYSQAIINWVKDITAGTNAAKVLERTLKNVRKEMAKTNADYGKNALTMRKLKDEYVKLKTEAEKQDWIKEHESDWQKLDIAMYSVADAERKFIERTKEVDEAFKQRAKAAAASKLAEEEFVKRLEKELKLKELEKEKEKYEKKDRVIAAPSGPKSYLQMTQTAIDLTNKEITAIDARIDALYNLARAEEAAADAEIGHWDKEDEDYGDIYGKGSGRDFIEYIERMRVSVIEKADKSITDMQISEFAKRREEAKKNYNKETGDLQNTLAKNKRILEGYYEEGKKRMKPLTEEQTTILKESNETIEKTLSNLKVVYDKTLRDIGLDEVAFWIEHNEKLVQNRLASVRKGSKEEYELRRKSIENQRKLEKAKNMKSDVKERQDKKAIDAKYDKQIEDINNEERLKSLKTLQESIKLRLEAVREGSKDEYDLRKASIQNQMEMELLENSQLATEEQQTEQDIRAKYNKQIEDLEYRHLERMIDMRKEAISLKLGNVQAGGEKELELTLDNIEQERKAALLANKQLAKELQQSEDYINAYYNKQRDYATGAFMLSNFRAQQSEKAAQVISPAKGERVKTAVEYGAEGSRKREVFELDREILDIERQLQLAADGQLNLSDEQIANLRLQSAELNKQKKELSGVNGVISDIANGGIAGGILGALGFDEDSISAFNSATDTILGNIKEIFDAEVEQAEKMLELQQKRVEAAQNAYDAELEARNNGYANNVETARKELEEERKKEAEKQKILEEAQKRQEAVNTITQTSSLITAAAQIWASMSGVPVVGPALAGTAIAAMFASFAVAKIRAAQVAQQSEQYGEGGLEFLEGGSHASGNDIDLGTSNSRGRNMRAEGGEALAVINKKNTTKYRNELPAIIESLNKGTFEDTYFKAFATIKEPDINIQNSRIDLSSIEEDVKSIRKNGEARRYITQGDTTIMYYKNLKRIVKN